MYLLTATLFVTNLIIVHIEWIDNKIKQIFNYFFFLEQDFS